MTAGTFLQRYCHMVAGLVGEGLTRAFVDAGFEDEKVMGTGALTWPFCAPPPGPRSKAADTSLNLANSMGLFLQKTNIIRDYLEDYADGRAFWPADVWTRFARTSELGEFARPTAHGAGAYPAAYDAITDPKGAQIVGKGVRTSALACLNYLVADALELVPDCIEYLARLRAPEVFRFSAIPQVMAIATLEECFDNPRVFTGVVKIRKGMAARLILDTGSIEGVHAWFHSLAKRIAERCPQDDPSRDKVVAACDAIFGITAAAAARRSQMAVVHSVLWTGLAAAAAAAAMSFTAS